MRIEKSRRRIEKLSARFKALETKYPKPKPRVVKKMTNLREKMFKELTKINRWREKMTEKISQQDGALVRVENTPNAPQPLPLKSLGFVKPSNFIFINKRRQKVVESVVQQIAATRRLFDEMAEMERSFQRLQEISYTLEIDSHQREIEREKLAYEREVIKQKRKLLKKQKRREDFENIP